MLIRMCSNPLCPPHPTLDPKPPRLQAGSPGFFNANLALSLGGFVCFMLLYGTQPLLPQLSDDFQVSPATASLTVSAGTMALAILLIPLSLVSDRLGRVGIMKLALLGATFFAGLSVLAPNFSSFVLARAGVGACIAGLPAAAMAYLGEELAVEARAKAMGMYIAANALGGMFGRMLSAAITQWFDWRWGLLAPVLMALLACVVFWRWIPPAQHFCARSLNPRLLFADVCKIYTDPGLPYLFVVAFLIMGVFVSAYNYLGFRLSSAPYFLGPAAVGMVFLLYAVGSASSAGAGFMTERFGRGPVMLWMIGLMMIGLFSTLADPLWAIVLGLAVFTFGYFATHAIASGWVGQRAGDRRGLVSALYLSSYYLGSSVMGSTTGLLWDHWAWMGVVCGLLVAVLIVGLIALYLNKTKPGQSS